MTRETESLIDNALAALFRLRDDCVANGRDCQTVQAALDDIEQWAKETTQ